MDFSPVVLSIPLYFLLIGMELTFQLVKRVKTYRMNDAIANMGCGIFSQIVGLITKVFSIGLYQWVYEHGSLAHVPDSLGSWLVLFVLVDFLYYWFHRASHEINFLWNTSHVVHHQSEDYNLSVALRQSAFGGLFSILFYLPLAFIGFSTYAFLTVKGINLIYQFWIHTESIKKMPRWFEYLFNTPSHHRVHHGRNPKYIDKNHAGTFMIWDRWLGTFQSEEEPPVYGVTRPVHTWNPVWANVLPLTEMTQQIATTSGLQNKLKVLFYKPGWKPVSSGSSLSIPEVDRQTYHKFDPHPDLLMTRYLFVQFVMILGFTGLFLFTASEHTTEIRLGLIFFISWSVGQLGFLMENKRQWLPLEYLRIITSGLLVGLYMPSLYGILAAGVFSTAFIIWLRMASQRAYE